MSQVMIVTTFCQSWRLEHRGTAVQFQESRIPGLLSLLSSRDAHSQPQTAAGQTLQARPRCCCSGQCQRCIDTRMTRQWQLPTSTESGNGKMHMGRFPAAMSRVIAVTCCGKSHHICSALLAGGCVSIAAADQQVLKVMQVTVISIGIRGHKLLEHSW